MERTGAEIITTLLERQGVSVVAGIPGGANLPLYDALHVSRVRHVLARHEQGAGFIAQGFARASGGAGVCLASSGPGATNLVTAVADAMSDSIPVVAITGQVPTSLMGTNAFQEVDTVGMMARIAKRTYFVRTPGELLTVIPEAFAVATSGRAGPVVIDVPKDVQAARFDVDDWPEPGQRAAHPAPDHDAIANVASLIARAKRPVLYVGGGVVASGASSAARELAHRARAFVVSSLHGLGAFRNDDPLFLGMLGMHGAPFTNHVLDEADLVVAVGARFDDRATGKASEFCKHATIVHIDADAREIGKNVHAHHAVVGDAKRVLESLIEMLSSTERPAWTARVNELRSAHPLPCNAPRVRGVLSTLAACLPRSTIMTTDVGQHQMWVAQMYPFMQPRTLLTSGGLGTMGFGVPAAIGAALARPGERVVCVTGDGSLLMNVQELATLAELSLPVTVVVLNNGHLGLVRQQQELFYGQRYHASRFDVEPDFAAIARGFGIRAVDVSSDPTDVSALSRAFEDVGTPLLVNVTIPPAENVLPMVPSGAANRDMIGARIDGPTVTASGTAGCT
jgi:acetolactate synthase-1/2/3 large subunit